jgi:hypothetical protein
MVLETGDRGKGGIGCLQLGSELLYTLRIALNLKADVIHVLDLC